MTMASAERNDTAAKATKIACTYAACCPHVLAFNSKQFKTTYPLFLHHIIHPCWLQYHDGLNYKQDRQRVKHLSNPLGPHLYLQYLPKGRAYRMSIKENHLMCQHTCPHHNQQYQSPHLRQWRRPLNQIIHQTLIFTHDYIPWSPKEWLMLSICLGLMVA